MKRESQKPPKSPKPSKKKTKKQVPDWATHPFHRFRDHQVELSRILHLSIRGISFLRAMPEALEALEILRPEDHPQAESLRDDIEESKKEAELAQREVDEGFPLLHSQAVVSLWTSLEDLVRTFLATWLANEPSAKQVDAIAKLKMSLGEYERLEEEERCLYAVELLERELQSPLRHGVSRFESLLQPFELSGKIDSEVQKHIYELYHVRNVLVHRRGIADKKLVESCPWLGLAPGDEVVVTHNMYGRYSKAVMTYVVELIQRVRVHLGFKRFDFEKRAKKEQGASRAQASEEARKDARKAGDA